jgi:hypothetical protein
LGLAVGAERTFDRLRTVETSGREKADRNGADDAYEMMKFHRLEAPLMNAGSDPET